MEILLGSCLWKRSNGLGGTGRRSEVVMQSQLKVSIYPTGNSEAAITLQACLDLGQGRLAFISQHFSVYGSQTNGKESAPGQGKYLHLTALKRAEG